VATDKNDDQREELGEDEDSEDTGVGLLGGGGPAATIDGDDDTLDEHGENLREADPGER
jgi:hypothetical protein